MEQRNEKTVINTNPYTTVCNGSVHGIIKRITEKSLMPSKVYLTEHELLSYGVAILSDN